MMMVMTMPMTIGKMKWMIKLIKKKYILEYI